MGLIDVEFEEKLVVPEVESLRQALSPRPRFGGLLGNLVRPAAQPELGVVLAGKGVEHVSPIPTKVVALRGIGSHGQEQAAAGAPGADGMKPRCSIRNAYGGEKPQTLESVEQRRSELGKLGFNRLELTPAGHGPQIASSGTSRRPLNAVGYVTVTLAFVVGPPL
jgi:hypothetical protein